MRLRVIDIETSGGTPSEIIEIAAVDVVRVGEAWIAEPPRARLFRPVGEITVHTMAIHHLTPEDFSEADAVCDHEQLTAFLREGGRPDAFVAHNAGFEQGHIPPEATDEIDWICTVKGAKRAWPEAPGYSNQVLRYWRGLRLDPALAMPPHRAGPDAWVTAHILIHLLDQLTPEDLLTATSAPRNLDRVPFGKHRKQLWADVPGDYLRWMAAQDDMAADVVARARAEIAARAASAAASAGR